MTNRTPFPHQRSHSFWGTYSCKQPFRVPQLSESSHSSGEHTTLTLICAPAAPFSDGVAHEGNAVRDHRCMRPAPDRSREARTRVKECHPITSHAASDLPARPIKERTRPTDAQAVHRSGAERQLTRAGATTSCRAASPRRRRAPPSTARRSPCCPPAALAAACWQP